jgi:HNH endonuclease
MTTKIKETTAEVDEFPGYVFYSDGRVFSKKTGKFKSTRITNSGYLSIVLALPFGTKTISHHRLIYMAFKGKISSGLQVNHIDGNKQNNCIENLEVISPKNNTLHSLYSLKKGCIKISKEDYDYILNNTVLKRDCPLLKGNVKEMCERFKISNSSVYDILKGKRYLDSYNKNSNNNSSWKEPRKVTISEEEFEQAWEDARRTPYVFNRMKHLLFGDE